jgi:long-chain acyl-CoA synthetase
MTDILPTVLQKFWTRAFNNPEPRALVVRSTEEVQAQLTLAMPVWTHKEYQSMNWGSTGKAVATVAAFLKSRGFKKGDRASICAWNSPAWVITDLAIQTLGGITAPIFPTTNDAGIQYILKNAGSTFFFSDDRDILRKAGKGSCEAVLFDEIPELLTGQKAKVALPLAQRFLSDHHMDLHPGLRCAIKSAHEEVLKAWQADPTLGIKIEDYASIVYTSGSTGKPKGVVLAHRNFAYACDGMIKHGFKLFPDRDVYLSYLPLSHVYERSAGMMLCLWTGVPMAFCRPDVKDELGNTLRALHPELLHAVPGVWRKMCENIDAGIAEKTLGFDKWLRKYVASEGDKTFSGLNKDWLAYAAQAALIRWARKQQRGTLTGKIADKLVISKIRKQLGGDIRLCTSGGGPISSELLQYFWNLGIEVLQGYGLTETTGAVTVNRPTGCGLPICNDFGSAGQLLAIEGLEWRIVPLDGWPKPKEGEPQNGEIQFKGPTMLVEYWQNPEETAKAFTPDGWFRTGDIGYIKNDSLYITGRLKRVLKSDNAKFLSPENVDKAFDQQKIVKCIVPVGDGKPFFSGFIFVDQDVARALLKQAAVEATPEQLADAVWVCRHPVIVKAVELAVAAGNASLEHWEQMKKFRVIEIDITKAGLLTDLGKPKVELITKTYEALIEEFYVKPKA